MFWIFELLLVLYLLYCFTFCSMVLYTSIIEEWWCQNRIPELIQYTQSIRYQQINENTQINLV